MSSESTRKSWDAKDFNYQVCYGWVKGHFHSFFVVVTERSLLPEQRRAKWGRFHKKKRIQKPWFHDHPWSNEYVLYIYNLIIVFLFTPCMRENMFLNVFAMEGAPQNNPPQRQMSRPHWWGIVCPPEHPPAESTSGQTCAAKQLLK